MSTHTHAAEKSVRWAHFRRFVTSTSPRFDTAPITVVLFALLFTCGLLMAIPYFQVAIHESFAFSWEQLIAGRIWTPVTSLILAQNVGSFLIELIVVALLLSKFEVKFGSARLITSYFGLGALANVCGGVLVESLAMLGEPWAVHGRHLLLGTPSVGIVAVLTALFASSAQVWRNRGLVLLGMYVGVMFAYSGQPNDFARGLAYLFGYAYGWHLVRGTHSESSRHSHQIFAPGHEVRVISSSLLTMLALGPLVALFSKVRMGALSPSLVLINNDFYRLDTLPCSIFNLGDRCTQWLMTGSAVRHHVTAFIQLFPVAMLLLCAWSLLRGRRAGIWVAIILLVRNCVGTVLFFLAQSDVNAGGSLEQAERVEFIFQIAAVIVVNFAAIGWLLKNRASFPITLSFRHGRVAGLWAALSLLVAASATVVLGNLMRSSLVGRPDQADLALSGLSLLMPPSARISLGLMIRTSSKMDRIPFQIIEILLWAALTFLTWRLVTRTSREVGLSSDRLMEALRTGYGTNLSFMATWPGNLLWEDPRTGAIVAYRAVAGVALTLSEPFGAKEADLMGIVTRFHQFADSRGLKPAWYSVGAEHFNEIAENLGWQSVEVASESYVNVQEWQTRGKSWQDVRTAISRAKRDGIESYWTCWRDLDVGIYAQVVELSQEWVEEHPLPEMGFTLGGLDQLQDPNVRLMLAIDDTGRLQAILSWLPTWREGEIVGWTLDFMRRHKDAMPGIMEFLIAQSAVQMREDGIEFMSLSGAPLVRTHTEEESTLLDDMLAFMSYTLEPVYGFRSLHRFKEKFKPQTRSWILVYPSAFDLPAIGIAVTRSYLPHLSVADALKAVREMSSSQKQESHLGGVPLGS